MFILQLFLKPQLYLLTQAIRFSAIHELSEKSQLKDSAWCYHPIVDINQPDHRAEMYAVKLHLIQNMFSDLRF